MAKRPKPPTPWREWFFSLLLGVGMAILCIALLSRGPTPVVQTSGTQSTAGPARRSIGLEFRFGIHILLPDNKGG